MAKETCAGCGEKIEAYMSGNICENCFSSLLKDNELTPQALQTRYNWF
jgi:predicted amidophosphoribosyltransferase